MHTKNEKIAKLLRRHFLLKFNFVAFTLFYFEIAINNIKLFVNLIWIKVFIIIII